MGKIYEVDIETNILESMEGDVEIGSACFAYEICWEIDWGFLNKKWWLKEIMKMDLEFCLILRGLFGVVLVVVVVVLGWGNDGDWRGVESGCEKGLIWIIGQLG